MNAGSQLAKLRVILGQDGKRTTAFKVAQYLGVSQVSMSRWRTGKAKMMPSSHRILLTLSVKVGELYPSIVQGVAARKPGTDALARLEKVTGNKVKVLQLLSVGSHVWTEWTEITPMSVRRLADLCEIVNALCPSMLGDFRATAADKVPARPSWAAAPVVDKNRQIMLEMRAKWLATPAGQAALAAGDVLPV